MDIRVRVRADGVLRRNTGVITALYYGNLGTVLE